MLLCDEGWIGFWCWVGCWPSHPRPCLAQACSQSSPPPQTTALTCPARVPWRRSCLPSEGALEEILLDVSNDGGGGGSLRALNADIGLDKIGPNEVSSAATADPSEATVTPSPGPSPSPIPTSTPPPPPPPRAPVALAIPRLEPAAPVVAPGLDADRYPEMPDGPDKVAWHNSPLLQARPAMPSSPHTSIGWMSSVRGDGRSLLPLERAGDGRCHQRHSG